MTKGAERLANVRVAMAAQGLDAFLVPRADEHLGEYVPPSAERLAWLTGFTGSAGLAIVLADRAAVFTDGRYTLQLAAQTDPALFERHHIVEEKPASWLAGELGPGQRVGYDPLLTGEDELATYAEAGLTAVAATPNPVDAAWTDRPAPPQAPALPHALEHAGVDSAEKRAQVAAALRKQRLDAAVVTDPAAIAWLLNIRGADVPFTPFALGFLLVGADEHATLFMDAAKLPPETRAWLGNGVSVQDRAALGPGLDALTGQRVGVDGAASPAWFAQRLRAAGATVVGGPSPLALLKARKNKAEQDGARAAHRRDAAAVCRFLHWLSGQAGQVTEAGAAEALLEQRRALPGFRGESFPAIAGAGEHGAIMHYRVTPETDRTIGRNEVFLIDSGAQFVDGTTDVTRTVWTGPEPAPAELRRRATMVLQGHIALATTEFPVGTAGQHLDALARRALWSAGLDYDHGTGHGVGSYLSVHEGPARIARAGPLVPLEEGMILSNEPGFYAPGEYGIRLENLLLVQAADKPGATKPFLRFETLTLAPFDLGLIDPALLSADERAWLDGYHARVLAEVGPALDAPGQRWLAEACRPLGASTTS